MKLRKSLLKLEEPYCSQKISHAFSNSMTTASCIQAVTFKFRTHISATLTDMIFEYSSFICFDILIKSP